jgi:hypothetical protein
MHTKELVPISNEVKCDSYVLNTKDSQTYEELFPGTTIFKNELGGTVITFSGTPKAEFNIVEAFSFLNYSRKLQLINLLKNTANLPVYFPGDEEVYLKCAKMQNGDTFVAIFNIGLDKIENIELVFEKLPTKIECLLPNGEVKEISFTQNGEKTALEIGAEILTPVILFVK